MQPHRLETSRHAQVLNVAGNQLSGPIPAAWARDPKAADGSVFPDLRVAALLPSAGHSLAFVGACTSLSVNARMTGYAAERVLPSKAVGGEEACLHCCGHAIYSVVDVQSSVHCR